MTHVMVHVGSIVVHVNSDDVVWGTASELVDKLAPHSLVPWPSQTPLFDCLQYQKLEPSKGLGMMLSTVHKLSGVIKVVISFKSRFGLLC